MRVWMSVSLMALVVTTVAFTQHAKSARDQVAQADLAWDAVGRLVVGGTGICTGSLIAQDLVLTAAHCLYDTSTGKRVNHDAIAFLAGWHDGSPSEWRAIRRAVVHPDYTGHGTFRTGRVRNDLALLELQTPIDSDAMVPFETAARPRKGDLVGVVSYERTRATGPRLQEVCEVLAQQDGVLVTTCDVDFGSSGAPIFVFRDGRAHVVSVISARAEADGRVVALGTALSSPLEVLKARLIAGEGYWSAELGDAHLPSNEQMPSESTAEEATQ